MAEVARFDIQRFVQLSRAVDLSDLDWQAAAHHGISDDERRILRYMADTEAHTILYLRDLLAGHTAHDPEVTAFLACWVYEETHHGIALDRFLAEVGYPSSKNQYTRVAAGAAFAEEVEAFLSQSAAKLTPHFAAAHMAWGALNEATAAAAYTALARTTGNPELAKLVTKLARDERRHYSFYYHQADMRLRAHPLARFLCRSALNLFWGPVGIGVGGTREVIELIFARFFSDREGRAEIDRIEAQIRALPGQSAFSKLSQARDRSLRGNHAMASITGVAHRLRFPQEAVSGEQRRRDFA